MPAVPVEHYPQLLSAVTQSEKNRIFMRRRGIHVSGGASTELD